MSSGPTSSSTRKYWNSLKKACFRPEDPNYKYFGAEGYYLCYEWIDYERFLADMGEKPSRNHKLSTRDKKLCKENCDWIIPRDYGKNDSVFYNHLKSKDTYEKFKELRKKFWSLGKIAEELGVSIRTIDRMSTKFKEEINGKPSDVE